MKLPQECFNKPHVNIILERIPLLNIVLWPLTNMQIHEVWKKTWMQMLRKGKDVLWTSTWTNCVLLMLYCIYTNALRCWCYIAFTLKMPKMVMLSVGSKTWVAILNFELLKKLYLSLTRQNIFIFSEQVHNKQISLECCACVRTLWVLGSC